MDDIQNRITETRQFDNYQKKMAKLPDIQKFCKNVRSKVDEQSSPSMQKESQDGQAEPLSDTAQANWLKWKEDLVAESNGKPFEIELRNEDDVSICGLVHATMAVMPDKYFLTSTWQIINNYFAKRNVENLEIETLNNFQKRNE